MISIYIIIFEYFSNAYLILILDECSKKDSKKKVIYLKSCFILIVACGECMLFCDWLPENWFILENSFTIDTSNVTTGRIDALI